MTEQAPRDRAAEVDRLTQQFHILRAAHNTVTKAVGDHTERLDLIDAYLSQDTAHKNLTASRRDPAPVCANCGHHENSHPARNSCRCLWCDCKAFAVAVDPVCPTCSERLERNCMGQWQCYHCGEHGQHLNPEMAVPTEPEPAPLDPVKGLRYVAMGPGWSGDTDDISQAEMWLKNNNGNGAIYVRRDLVSYGREGGR